MGSPAVPYYRLPVPANLRLTDLLGCSVLPTHCSFSATACSSSLRARAFSPRDPSAYMAHSLPLNLFFCDLLISARLELMHGNCIGVRPFR